MALTTEEEATESNVQHKRPCADCPWRRKSIPGWLGSGDVASWLQAAHGEARVDCHTVKGDPQPQCAGVAIYRANVLKLPRDPETLRLKKNPTVVFDNPADFARHHSEGIAERASNTMHEVEEDRPRPEPARKAPVSKAKAKRLRRERRRG